MREPGGARGAVEFLCPAITKYQRSSTTANMPAATAGLAAKFYAIAKAMKERE